MAEMTMAEAAEALGVSLDTIRRRVRRGIYPVRRDERGRNLVDVHGHAGAVPVQTPVQGDTGELLAAERRRSDEMAAQVETLRRQLEAANEGQRELRILLFRQSEQLSTAQQQLQALLPAPAEPHEEHEAQGESSESQGQASGPPQRSWLWRLLRGS
jgi:hypothetical protein